MPLTRQEGEFSQVSNIVTVPIPPVPPSAVVLTLGPSLTEADLSWTAATPALGDTIDGYQVWRNVDGGAFALLTTVAGNVLVYNDLTVDPDSVYDYFVIAHGTIGGDSAHSNTVEWLVVQAVTQILVGFMGDETWLISTDFTSVIQGGSPNSDLGYQNGYELNADGSIIGSYGGYLEGSSAGANRSDDFGNSYTFLGAPIYNNAPPRAQRVAYGGDLGDRYFLHMGTRTAGQPSCAWSDVFGNDAFTWNAISLSLFVTVPTTGFAGVDAIPVDSAVDDGNTLFCTYTHAGQVYAGDGKNGMILYGTGGPSIAFDSSNNAYARFAGQGFGDNDKIVGMYAGKIVVTVNGSETWDMTTYNDAFTEATLIGGVGFNNPVIFGLAYGAGVWIACGNIPGDSPGTFVPQISRSTVAAETPWPTITVPPDITALWDVIYDKTNSRFLMVGQERFDDPETEITTFFFHVLQSVDGGLTWTDEVRQQYNSGQDPDKGWIKVFEAAPPSFDMLQEDGFSVLQEDGSHILVSDSEPPVDVPPVFTLVAAGVNESMSWTAAVPASGTVTGYEIWRTSAQEFEGLPNFSNPSGITVNDLLTLLDTVSPSTFNFLDTTADNSVVQYAYNVRALTTFGFIDSNIEFSSAVT